MTARALRALRGFCGAGGKGESGSEPFGDSQSLPTYGSVGQPSALHSCAASEVPLPLPSTAHLHPTLTHYLMVPCVPTLHPPPPPASGTPALPHGPPALRQRRPAPPCARIRPAARTSCRGPGPRERARWSGRRAGRPPAVRGGTQQLRGLLSSPPPLIPSPLPPPHPPPFPP